MTSTVRSLTCPRCRDVELDPLSEGAVEIDACSTCRGVWLDAGEWRPMLGPEAATSTPAAADALAGLADCPACAATRPGPPARLVARSVVGVPGVTIDACPACEGAWLDGGELPRIRQGLAAARARSAPPPLPAAAPAGASPAATTGPSMGTAVLSTAGAALLGLLQVAATARPRRGFGWGRRRRGRVGIGGVGSLIGLLLRLVLRR